MNFKVRVVKCIGITSRLWFNEGDVLEFVGGKCNYNGVTLNNGGKLYKCPSEFIDYFGKSGRFETKFELLSEGE